MQEISRSSLGELKTVFKSNEENIYYYKLIQKLLSDETLIEFAQPVIQSNAGYVIWRSKFTGPFSRYTDLKDAGVRSQINNDVRLAFSVLEKKVNSFKEVNDFYEKITEIPREDSIFYFKKDNTFIIILTEWGFFLDEFRKGQGVLKKVFPSGLQSFIINFINVNGEPVQNILAEITLDDRLERLKSDNSGVIRLNNVLKDSTINVKSPDKKFGNIRVNTKEKSEIDVVIDSKVVLLFKVEDSFGRPVISEGFRFVSERLGNLECKTDDNGHFSISHFIGDGEFKVFHNTIDLVLEKPLPIVDSEYKIILDLKENVVQEESFKDKGQVLGNSEQNSIKEVTIELLDRKNNPIKGHKVDFYGTSGKVSYTTDDKGCFKVEELVDGIEYALFMDYKKSGWKKDFTHSKGSDKYTFVVKQRRVLWWWLPLLLFALFFFLVPLSMKHTYKALDASTEKPIEGAVIQCKIQNSISTFNSYLTDSNGVVNINYGKKTMFRQLLFNLHDNIIAYRSDYSLLEANVPIGFFRRWKSNLYLDKNDVLNAIIPCNGGEAHNDEGNQIFKFDLGKSNVEFLFEYFNDTQLDIISVYSEDGQMLFQLNKTTNTADFLHSTKISSPTRFIKIVIDGTSHWGIKVHCPN